MAILKAPVVRMTKWAWLIFIVSGAANFFLQLFFWRFRPGAPDLQLGFLHKIELANGIAFVSEREFLANSIFQTIAGISVVLIILATAASMGIDRFGSSARQIEP